jgi:hypothetical protein
VSEGRVDVLDGCGADDRGSDYLVLMLFVIMRNSTPMSGLPIPLPLLASHLAPSRLFPSNDPPVTTGQRSNGYDHNVFMDKFAAACVSDDSASIKGRYGGEDLSVPDDMAV